jgi:putative flavoprotein involved in K+ transport
VWRSRWDSLRLFTAAEYDALPDLPFPAAAGSHPGKDDVADYLEAYARTFGLPIRLGTRVTRLARSAGGWTATTTTGTVHARQVVVATGPFSAPHVPAVARGLGSDVVQVHSSAYRRPADLPEGPVLVVGAGNSGVQIAQELAEAGRPVTLAVGSRPQTVPQRPLGRDLFWWLTRSGLIRATADSRLGRRFRQRELVIGSTWRGLRGLGIDLRSRLVDAADAAVRFADGTSADVAGVVWATGFRPDHGWIDAPGAFADGVLVHRRGVTPEPGLSFLGLPWQHTRGSALLGFVQDDAAWLTRQLLTGRETDLVPV